MAKQTKPVPSLLEIECKLITTDAGNVSLQDFDTSLWYYLHSNKRAVDKYARELNIYPRMPEVHQAVINHLTGGIYA